MRDGLPISRETLLYRGEKKERSRDSSAKKKLKTNKAVPAYGSVCQLPDK